MAILEFTTYRENFRADVCLELIFFFGIRITGPGSSGAVPPSASSTTKKSKTPSAQKQPSSSARPRSRRRSLQRSLSPPPLSGVPKCPPNQLTYEQIMGIKSRTFDIPSASLVANGGTATSAAGAGDKSYRVKLTEKEKKRVEKLIKNAKSLQEIARLEKDLNDGRVPQGGGGGGVDDEMEE